MAEGKGLNLWLAIRAIDKATKPLQRIGRAVQQVGRQTGLDVVGRRLGKLRSSLGETGRQAGRFIRGLGAATGVIGAAGFGLTGRFAAFADDVLKTSRRLGLTTDALQRYRYAAKLSGLSTQTFDMAMQRFGRRAAEAAAGTGEAKDALEFLRQEYGVQLRDAEGKIRPVEKIFEDVAEAMSKIENPLLRNRVAMKLFDSEGVAMVQMMGEGRKGLRKMGEEAASLGLVFPRETLEQGEEYTDAFTRMKESLSALGNAIGADLLPYMKQIVEKITEWSQRAKPEIVEQVKLAFADLGAVMNWLDWLFGAIGRGIGNFLDWLESTHPAVAEWIGKLRGGAEEMGAFRLAVAGVVAWLGAKFVFALGRSFVAMLLFIGSLGAAIVRTVIFAGVLAGSGALSLVSGFKRFAQWIGFAVFALRYFLATAVIGRVVAMAGAFWGVARAAGGLALALMANPIVWIAVGIAAAVAAIGYAAYLIYEHWRSIPAFFAGVWRDIKAWFLTPLGEWDNAIAEAVLGAWKAVIGGLKGLPAWFMGIWSQVEAAFDIAGWIEELRGWSLTATMQGWVAGAVSWFQRTWSSVEAAFDIAGWIEELRGWSLTATMQGWIAGAVSWFQRTWSRIEAAFDVAGWIEALRGWSLTATMQGWVAGSVSWFQRTWSQVEAAFDIAGWIEALRSWSLTATMQGWVAGAVSWFQRTWSQVEAAFDVAGWLETLRSWSLTATIKGWFLGALTWVAGWWRDFGAQIGIDALVSALSVKTLYGTIVGWFGGALAWVENFWGDIRYAIGIDRLVTWLNTWDFDVLSAIKGWFGGVVSWVTKTWGEIKAAIGIEALIEWLEGFSFWQIAMNWIDSLWAGVIAGWQQFVAWFHGAIEDAIGPFTWALRQVGLLPDEDETQAARSLSTEGVPERVLGLRQPAARSAAPAAAPFSAPPVPSAIGPGSEVLQGGVSQQQIAQLIRVLVGGEVRIGFDNPPPGMRVKSVRSDNPDVDIDVTAGYALAGS